MAQMFFTRKQHMRESQRALINSFNFRPSIINTIIKYLNPMVAMPLPPHVHAYA